MASFGPKEKLMKWKHTADLWPSNFPKRRNGFVVGVVTFVSPSNMISGMKNTEGGFGCVLTMHMTRLNQETQVTTGRYVSPLVMNICRVLDINNIKCVFAIFSTSL
jgi:hypothetical protein